MSSSNRRSANSGSQRHSSGSGNGNGNGHRASHSSSDRYSDMSSIQEIARPSTSAGPRRQTGNTSFYSAPGGVADITNAGGVSRRPDSQTSQPPRYTSAPSPTPTYTSNGYQQPGPSGSGHRTSGSGSLGAPPSYHSRPTSQQPPQGQGYGQQQQQQQQQYQAPPPPPAPATQHLAPPAPQGGRRNLLQRSSERLRRMFHRDRSDRGEGSGGQRRR